MNSPTFVDKDFFRMYHPSCMPLVEAYLDEEQLLIKGLYRQHPELECSYLIEVGGGNGMSIETMKELGCNNHLAVDPFPKEDLSIECIQGIFENLSFDLLPEGPKIYFFHFNVTAYITDLSTHLNRLVREDDWVFFSQWTNTAEVEKIYTEYFHFFTGGRFMENIDPYSQRVPVEKISMNFPCLELSEVRRGKFCELLLTKSHLFSFTC